jgi:hypothetical protein
VTAPPKVLSLTRDGRIAFVAERLRRRAPDVELARELCPGRTLTAIDLSDKAAPTIADAVEVGPAPEVVRASPDGRRVAVVSNTPEASLIEIVSYSEGRFGRVETFRLSDLGITGDASDPVGASPLPWSTGTPPAAPSRRREHAEPGSLLRGGGGHGPSARPAQVG